MVLWLAVSSFHCGFVSAYNPRGIFLSVKSQLLETEKWRKKHLPLKSLEFMVKTRVRCITGVSLIPDSWKERAGEDRRMPGSSPARKTGRHGRKITKKLSLQQHQGKDVSYGFPSICETWHMCASIRIYKNTHSENTEDMDPCFYTSTDLLTSATTSF